MKGRALGDDEVAELLRSDHPLVVNEAPAGCGKTHQGAQYAADEGRPGSKRGRVLVLTHTHAAADEFSSRAEELGSRVDVRTIDSLIVEIAGAYHPSLGLPEDVGRWASEEPGRFRETAELVARLLSVASGPGRALARRYPVVIFDEHQDANEAQSAILDALLRSGAKIRVFGDPMQVIYPDTVVEEDWRRWEHLCERSPRRGELDTPHRWRPRSNDLGAWILEARAALKEGDPVDLTAPHPKYLTVYRADDVSTGWGQYRTSKTDGRPIWTRSIFRPSSGMAFGWVSSTTRPMA